MGPADDRLRCPSSSPRSPARTSRASPRSCTSTSTPRSPPSAGRGRSTCPGALSWASCSSTATRVVGAQLAWQLAAHGRRARRSASATSAPGACCRSTAATACGSCAPRSPTATARYTDLTPRPEVVRDQRAPRLPPPRHDDRARAEPALAGARLGQQRPRRARAHAHGRGAAALRATTRAPSPRATSSCAAATAWCYVMLRIEPPRGPAGRVAAARAATPSCFAAMAKPLARHLLLRHGAVATLVEDRASPAGARGPRSPCAARSPKMFRSSHLRPRTPTTCTASWSSSPGDPRGAAPPMRMHFHHLVSEAAARRPDATGADVRRHDGRPTRSCGDAGRRVRRGAARAWACARGERVAIHLEKRIETVVAMFGASAAGGVFVPVNPLLKAKQVAHILGDCEVTRPRHDARSASRCSTTSRRRARRPRRRRERRRRLPLGRPGAARRAAATTASLDVDMAAILYTSGSTGLPKGVVLSHRNLLAGAESVSTYLGNDADDVILAALPLSFDAGPQPGHDRLPRRRARRARELPAAARHRAGSARSTA